MGIGINDFGCPASTAYLGSMDNAQLPNPSYQACLGEQNAKMTSRYFPANGDPSCCWGSPGCAAACESSNSPGSGCDHSGFPTSDPNPSQAVVPTPAQTAFCVATTVSLFSCDSGGNCKADPLGSYPSLQDCLCDTSSPCSNPQKCTEAAPPRQSLLITILAAIGVVLGITALVRVSLAGYTGTAGWTGLLLITLLLVAFVVLGFL